MKKAGLAIGLIVVAIERAAHNSPRLPQTPPARHAGTGGCENRDH